jgi:hypothetical protein
MANGAFGFLNFIGGQGPNFAMAFSERVPGMTRPMR